MTLKKLYKIKLRSRRRSGSPRSCPGKEQGSCCPWVAGDIATVFACQKHCIQPLCNLAGLLSWTSPLLFPKSGLSSSLISPDTHHPFGCVLLLVSCDPVRNCPKVTVPVATNLHMLFWWLIGGKVVPVGGHHCPWFWDKFQSQPGGGVPLPGNSWWLERSFPLLTTGALKQFQVAAMSLRLEDFSAGINQRVKVIFGVFYLKRAIPRILRFSTLSVRSSEVVKSIYLSDGIHWIWKIQSAVQEKIRFNSII